MTTLTPTRILKYVVPVLRLREVSFGYCYACNRATVFVLVRPDLRLGLMCVRCGSLPRHRALMVVLEEVVPHWRALRIFEPSPAGAGSARMAREAPGYLSTVFRANAGKGQTVNGRRSEDLAHLTFASESFDLVVTQDVFEHVADPGQALREVARVLKPGGHHIFTVPCDFTRPTRSRVERLPDGALRDVLPRVWHGDPFDDNGALVVTDWGSDITEQIAAYCGMQTTAYLRTGRRRGLLGEQREVFVSTKASRATSATN